ncbi:IniB N-terminal domain-containing protein [Nocardia australiensis]|uniref:IniB N-terminal domain-containing protein n=1 Tax=Nocardia australiensis TaxID=2887191 RepID=UPI001D14A16E|nr:IniB N-terminal domain-containing protein [Nocardia australiensis]
MTPNAILEFILNLLRHHEAAVAHCANPGQALAAAGLSAVTPEDIAAVAPMVAESALVTGGSQLSSIVATRFAGGHRRRRANPHRPRRELIHRSTGRC